MKKGYRIWEIQENKVPKEILKRKKDVGIPLRTIRDDIDNLDLENKTYAIRIGKDGLK
jgi:molybdate-binding protein